MIYLRTQPVASGKVTSPPHGTGLAAPLKGIPSGIVEIEL